jgi:two-component system chemotaxis response regulator CheB
MTSEGRNAVGAGQQSSRAPWVGRALRAVVMGGSAGGTTALHAILSHLPDGYSLPIVVAHHLHKSDGGSFVEHLASRARLRAGEALDKQAIEPG